MSAMRTFLRYEDVIFGWMAKAEYELGLAKRGTRLVPTRMHRWMLRCFLGAFITMVVAFEAAPLASRPRYMLLTLLLLFLVAMALLLIDALPGIRALPPARKPPSSPPRPPVSPRPPASRPGAKQP